MSVTACARAIADTTEVHYTIAAVAVSIQGRAEHLGVHGAAGAIVGHDATGAAHALLSAPVIGHEAVDVFACRPRECRHTVAPAQAISLLDHHHGIATRAPLRCNSKIKVEHMVWHNPSVHHGHQDIKVRTALTFHNSLAPCSQQGSLSCLSWHQRRNCQVLNHNQETLDVGKENSLLRVVLAVAVAVVAAAMEVPRTPVVADGAVAVVMVVAVAVVAAAKAKPRMARVAVGLAVGLAAKVLQ